MHRRMTPFQRDLQKLIVAHRKLIARRNRVDPCWRNGLFDRYQYPVLTAAHTPLFWRFDLNQDTNPFLIERLGINSVFNPGAIEFEGRIILLFRLEGADGRSFFAVAESRNPVERFRFRDHPVILPETGDPDIDVGDMRLTQHADGWIYGLFNCERRQAAAAPGAAQAHCGIARTHDLLVWERLPDLKPASSRLRHVVLHPEFVDGQYALYTRPPADLGEIGQDGGLGWALTASMEHAEIPDDPAVTPSPCHADQEKDKRAGAPPIKTPAGWLHIAQGVRKTAAGSRCVLYAFLCDLARPDRIVRRPGGCLLAPLGEEHLGDASNKVACNGVVQRANGEVFIYYSSGDTRIHVARTTQSKLLDYLQNAPPAPLRAADCVQQRLDLIRRNLACAPRLPRAAPTMESRQ